MRLANGNSSMNIIIIIITTFLIGHFKAKMKEML